jgi:hypothetical protein
MAFLVTLIYLEILLLFFGFFGLIAIRILMGQISTQGLLYGAKGDGTKYLSPERVQLLLFTIGAAFQYIAKVLQNPTAFPAVQESWIAILAGSHVVYLGGKFGASLLGRKMKSS